MKRKEKMALIDNYIKIFQILYKCKINLIFAKSKEEILLLDTICQKLLFLKKEHEDLLQKNKGYDNAFILLKKQLEDGLNNYKQPTTLPFSTTFLNKANTIEENFKNIQKKSCKKFFQ